MGKGNRNRQLHLQDKMDNPQKYKEQKRRKPMPQWAKTTICVVLLIGVLFGVGSFIFTKYGIIERNRTIIESKTGEFDVNQQIATYVAWQNIFYEATMEWMYMKYGLLEDTYGITKQGADTYVEQERYALAMAQTYLETNLRDAIDASIDTLIELVAICDEAYINNVTLDENDMTKVQESIDSLTTMALKYNYLDLGGFLTDNMFYGMLESDVETAVEMSTLYNKYKTMTQVGFEKAITPADLVAFRDAHPEDFYKMDYLSFTTDSEDFAKKLTADGVINADQFKELILEDHFQKNYKTSYNKFVTQAAVTEIFNSVNPLTDTETSKALSDKLDALGFEAKTTYKEADENDETLEKWLFDSKRKEFEVATFTNKAADGIYIVTFYAKTEGGVEARAKLYPLVEGDSYESDTNFKANILTYIKELKKDSTNFPEVPYQDAAKKGAAFKEACEKLATAAEQKKYFTDNNAKEIKNVTADTSEDKLPTALRDQLILLAPEEIGSIHVINDGVTSYVVYMLALDAKSENYDFLYVTLEADDYYLIIDDMVTSLNKVYPTDKSTNLVADAKENTFEAWISERGSSAIVSARKEFDKKYFTTSTTEKDGTTKTTHTVYMVVNTPMYLDETISVNGGYIPFYGKVNGLTASQQAEKALATLQGKTHAEALAALEALTDTANNISPTISTTITEESLKNYAQLKKWYFEEERQPNSMAVVGTEGKTEVYLALCIEKAETWKNEAKAAAVTERMTTWVSGLTAGYTANQDALDAIGEPTTTTAAAA